MGVTELIEHKLGTSNGHLCSFLGRTWLRMKPAQKKAEPRIGNTYLMVAFEGLDPAKPEAGTTPGLFRTEPKNSFC